MWVLVVISRRRGRSCSSGIWQRTLVLEDLIMLCVCRRRIRRLNALVVLLILLCRWELRDRLDRLITWWLKVVRLW